MIKEKLLPMQELKMFGVYRDGKFTIPEEQVRALREGRMTDVVELKNLKGKDVQIDSLPARLSIVRGADGNPSPAGRSGIPVSQLPSPAFQRRKRSS